MRAEIKALYSRQIAVDTAVCLPSGVKVHLRSKYEVPEGTSSMVFNPANIPDIVDAFQRRADAS